VSCIVIVMLFVGQLLIYPPLTIV